eukprot:291778-Prorocentrum_minimum.AAC.1
MVYLLVASAPLAERTGAEDEGEPFDRGGGGDSTAQGGRAPLWERCCAFDMQACHRLANTLQVTITSIMINKYAQQEVTGRVYPPTRLTNSPATPTERITQTTYLAHSPSTIQPLR